MSLGKRRKKILDGEALFRYYYIDMGTGRSYPKLARWATEKWGPSPETKKEWTNGAVWQAAWRWVFDDMKTAREIYADTMLQQGDVLTDDEWYLTVAKHARSCMKNGQYRRFLIKHPELKPYEVL